MYDALASGQWHACSRDAPPYFLDLVAEPDGAEIVVVIAQVAEFVGAHAARPYGPVAVDVAAGPAGVTRNYLIFLIQNALDQLVILDAERLGDLRDAPCTGDCLRGRLQAC